MKKFLFFLSLFVWIRHATGQIISTVVGTAITGFGGDGGQATFAKLNYPSGIAFDKFGNLYIADVHNQRIRKVNSSGIINTVAGNGVSSYSGNGGQATSATLNDPYGVALDTAGNLYIAEFSNHVVRKVTTSGIISTVAGNGVATFAGDGGPATAASLYNPTGITVDINGNLFIADYGNNAIRKVDTAGIITTIAGNGTGAFAGDGGQATAACIYHPFRVAFDYTGNLYIADKENNRIRKVSTAGIISTFAGNGTPSYSGDGGPAVAAGLNTPTAVTFDNTGNLYIGDEYNNVIRVVNTIGVINTFAGNGTAAYGGDGGPAVAAELNNPSGVVFDAAGNLYIVDENNSRIRKIIIDHAAEMHDRMNRAQVTVCPNPTSNQFFINAQTTDKLTVDLYDVSGRHVISKIISDKANIDVTTLNDGVYTLIIKTVDCFINKKIIILH